MGKQEAQSVRFLVWLLGRTHYKRKGLKNSLKSMNTHRIGLIKYRHERIHIHPNFCIYFTQIFTTFKVQEDIGLGQECRCNAICLLYIVHMYVFVMGFKTYLEPKKGKRMSVKSCNLFY